MGEMNKSVLHWSRPRLSDPVWQMAFKRFFASNLESFPASMKSFRRVVWRDTIPFLDPPALWDPRLFLIGFSMQHNGANYFFPNPQHQCQFQSWAQWSMTIFVSLSHWSSNSKVRQNSWQITTSFGWQDLNAQRSFKWQKIDIMRQLLNCFYTQPTRLKYPKSHANYIKIRFKGFGGPILVFHLER